MKTYLTWFSLVAGLLIAWFGIRHVGVIESDGRWRVRNVIALIVLIIASLCWLVLVLRGA